MIKIMKCLFPSAILFPLVIVFLQMLSSAVYAAETTQRDILISLYNATGGANWTNKTGWLGAEGPECSWHGVACDGDGKVTHLNLDRNNLVGSIPSEIGGLSSLQQVFMGGNQLSGTIPSSITQLVNLNGIWLWGNQLSGSLPAFFGEMAQLSRLSLGGNQFSGSIPVSFGNLVNLLDLDLAYNQLSGNIPAELGNLVNATGINLRDNQLSGAVPAQVQNLGTVNLWANPNLTGIAFGDPAACDNQTPMALGAAINGELTPFVDCYFDDERIMADFYRLDLNGESGTTLFKIDAYSDHYYPHIGVLDANGNDGQDIVDTQIQQNGLSFEVALPPGEYVLYIHGGSYQPQNVAATGVYTLSTTVINHAQVDCVAPTWVTKGVALDAALSSDDCLDTFNDPDRLYDSYKIWLEQGESVAVALTAEFESQLLHFNGNQYNTATPFTAAGQQQVLLFTATNSGWHRYAVYTNNNNPLAEGNYNIQFLEPPVFGDAQACTEGLPTLALGGSTSGAALDQDTDCYRSGRMVDRYVLSLSTDSLFKATLSTTDFDPLLSVFTPGANGTLVSSRGVLNQSSVTVEYYLPAGEYWLSASSRISNALAPVEGSYTLALTEALPVNQVQDGCMPATVVRAGLSLSGDLTTTDCRDTFVVNNETSPYLDGFQYIQGAGQISYPTLVADFPVRLSHWFNGMHQGVYSANAGEDIRIALNRAGTHTLYVIGQSVNDLGSYQLDLLQSQPDLETVPIAFSFTFTDFRNVIDGEVQTGPSDHVLTGIVDAVMADDDVFEVVGIREASLDGNAYVIANKPGIVAVRPDKPALLSLSGNLLDVLICPNGFGAVNDCPFGTEGGFLISDFWPISGSTAGQGGALAGHSALGASYRDRSIPIVKSGWSAHVVTEGPSQRDILISLYNATGGANWSNKTGWQGAEGPECSWHGVQCDGDNKVTGLDLNQNNLVGSIPSALGDLSSLQFISLGGNQLSGTIPSSIAQLENLRGIWLWSNQLSGQAPEFFGQLTQLQYLNLSGNQLSGTIPVSYGNLVNILELDLAYNTIEGQIPASLGNLSNATSIRLDNNILSGDIPQAVSDLGTVNLWGNVGLNIMKGDPDACVAGLSLASGDSINGDLTPYTDCYLPERNVMVDYYSLDLTEASGTTLLSIEADSQRFWPSIGILDANGDSFNTVMMDRSGQPPFSVQAALQPGEYLLLVHGGEYTYDAAPNVPATGPYSLSLSLTDELQIGCRPFLNTWVTKGVAIEGALSSDDCVDTHNNLNRLYDDYSMWLEQGESVRVDAQSPIASQVLVFNEAGFVGGSLLGVPNVAYSMRFTASQSGWYRVAMYNALANAGVTDDYSISFSDTGAFSAEERTALIALYNATGGANWTNKTGWLGAEGTECSWFGVSCDGYGVININLIGNGLVGTIPSALSQLSELRTLRLNNNQLTGSIPAELGQLAKLNVLSLYTNQLSGNIPAELGQLSNLNSLSLFGNQLSGSIPIELGQLTNLTGLALQSNQLSGSIPAQLGQLSNLTSLALFANQLSGTIPSELGSLVSLKSLHLFNNQLSGAIPASLGQLSNLTHLYLYQNQLSGSIPSTIGQLSNLVQILLYENQLSGSIPATLGQLSKLTLLGFRDNRLSGTIPAEFGQLSSLTTLILSNNLLTGSIPAALTQLNNLAVLNLSNNNLTGSLPAFSQSVAVSVDGNSLDLPPAEIPAPTTPVAPPQVTEQLNELNGDVDALELIEIVEGQQIGEDVVNQVGNALDKTNALATQVTGSLPEGEAGVGVALNALDTMTRTLTASAKVSTGGGAVSNTAATNSINSVATVLNALSTRTESITPQQRATVQALASTTVSNSSNLIRAGATNDELVSMVAATSAVINAASAAGGALTPELVSQAEALVTKAVKTGMTSFSADVDVNDPVQLGNLLRTNPNALQFAIDASVAVKSRIKPDTTAVNQELASRGIEGAASQNLTSVLNAVSNPDGISVGGSSASEVLLSALVQFLTGGSQAQTITGGLQSLALSTGGIDLKIDPLTGTVMITAPGEKYSAAIVNTRIVSASVPAGLSFMRDGRALIVANGVAMELAPIAADLIGFTNAVEKAGFAMTLRDGGLVEITLSATERFVGVFAFDNISNANGSCGATTIVEPTGALNSPSYAFGLSCANGVQQRIVPFVHDPAFFRSVAGFKLTVSTDRNTGIVTIPEVGRYKPSFFVSKLTASDEAYLQANKDARGSAFKEMDMNDDGLVDILFYTAAGTQVLYKVAP